MAGGRSACADPGSGSTLGAWIWLSRWLVHQPAGVAADQAALRRVEHIPRSGGVILAANHLSQADPFTWPISSTTPAVCRGSWPRTACFECRWSAGCAAARSRSRSAAARRTRRRPWTRRSRRSTRGECIVHLPGGHHHQGPGLWPMRAADRGRPAGADARGAGHPDRAVGRPDSWRWTWSAGRCGPSAAPGHGRGRAAVDLSRPRRRPPTAELLGRSPTLIMGVAPGPAGRDPRRAPPPAGVICPPRRTRPRGVTVDDGQPSVLGAGSWGTAFAQGARRRRRRRRRWSGAAGAGRRGQPSGTQPRLPAGRPRCRPACGPPSTRPRRWTAPTSWCSRCRRRRCATTSPTGRPLIEPDATLVSLIKGIELGTAKRMSEVIDEVAGAPADRVAVVTGPNLAQEIADEQPAATVVACVDEGQRRRCCSGPAPRPYFRPYTNNDVVGCELGGAVKNVIALAYGMAAGMGFGDNTRATLITRGLAETARLGARARRRPAHLRRAGRARRPGRHLQLAAVAQPHLRRAAGPRRVAGAGQGGDPARPPRASRAAGRCRDLARRVRGGDADHRAGRAGLPRPDAGDRPGADAHGPGHEGRATGAGLIGG